MGSFIGSFKHMHSISTCFGILHTPTLTKEEHIRMREKGTYPFNPPLGSSSAPTPHAGTGCCMYQLSCNQVLKNV